MGHTYYIHYGHLVFHVGRGIIHTSDLQDVHELLFSIAMRLKAREIVVGGTEDHVHMLFDLPLTKAISPFVRELKTTATHTLKGRFNGYRGFSWQTGFGYFSVSRSMYQIVADYIANQRQHHTKESAGQEFERLIDLNGALVCPPFPAPQGAGEKHHRTVVRTRRVR